MYTLCGRGPRSSLRVLRHGLEVISCEDSVIACLENWECQGVWQLSKNSREIKGSCQEIVFVGGKLSIAWGLSMFIRLSLVLCCFSWRLFCILSHFE